MNTESAYTHYKGRPAPGSGLLLSLCRAWRTAPLDWELLRQVYRKSGSATKSFTLKLIWRSWTVNRAGRDDAGESRVLVRTRRLEVSRFVSARPSRPTIGLRWFLEMEIGIPARMGWGGRHRNARLCRFEDRRKWRVAGVSGSAHRRNRCREAQHADGAPECF